MKLSVNKVSGRRRAAAKADAQSPKAKIKANDMKPAPIITQPDSDSVAQEQAAKQELVAPHEWATLLNTPENEFSDLGGAPVPEAPQAETATDDLWERLSSTRWIKVAPEHDFHNRSTIANRPSEN